MSVGQEVGKRPSLILFHAFSVIMWAYSVVIFYAIAEWAPGRIEDKISLILSLVGVFGITLKAIVDWTEKDSKIMNYYRNISSMNVLRYYAENCFLFAIISKIASIMVWKPVYLTIMYNKTGGDLRKVELYVLYYFCHFVTYIALFLLLTPAVIFYIIIILPIAYPFVLFISAVLWSIEFSPLPGIIRIRNQKSKEIIFDADVKKAVIYKDVSIKAFLIGYPPALCALLITVGRAIF